MTLYIEDAPLEIPCLYCGQPCPKFHYDQRLFPTLDYSKSYRWEYHCDRHPGLDIEVTCVKHDRAPPNWFFNRIAVTHNNLRLYWNFYAGDWAHLEYRERRKDGSISEWRFVHLQPWPPKWQTYPVDILFQEPEKIKSFFKMYSVFS